MPTSADPAGPWGLSSTLMHVPTQRGPKAAHRTSGRKLSMPSFPPRFPGVTSRYSGGRIVLGASMTYSTRDLVPIYQTSMLVPRWQVINLV